MTQRPFILIVEDDDHLRSIESRYLNAAGYTVLEAASFEQALEQIAIKPSIVILDIMLPDLSGWDVAGWLSSQGENVPIIITSGSRLDTRKVSQVKPVAILPKPFAMPELLGLVVKYATPS